MIWRNSGFGTILNLTPLAIVIFIGKYYPSWLSPISFVSLVVGIVGIGVGMHWYGRYLDMFDYEEAELWGRPMKAKDARSRSLQIAYISGAFLILGLLIQIVT